MLVPLVTMGALYEADAALRQASRHQALPSKVCSLFVIQPIELLCRFRFLVDLKGLWPLRLHSESQFEGLNAPLQLRVMLAREGMPPVLLLNHVQLEPLQVSRDALRYQVFNGLGQLLHFHTRIANRGALIGRGKKS